MHQVLLLVWFILGASDQRLQTPVQLSTELMPVGVVAQQLSKQAGITLRVDPAVADLKLAVFLKGQTLDAALKAIAKALDLSWVKEGEEPKWTYRLHQTAEQAKRMKDAKAAAESEIRKDDQNRLKKQIASLPENYEQMMREHARKTIESLIDRNSTGSNRVEPGLHEYLTAYVAKQFSPKQWDDFWKGGEIRLHSGEQKGPFKLPPNFNALMSLSHWGSGFYSGPLPQKSMLDAFDAEDLSKPIDDTCFTMSFRSETGLQTLITSMGSRSGFANPPATTWHLWNDKAVTQAAGFLSEAEEQAVFEHNDKLNESTEAAEYAEPWSHMHFGMVLKSFAPKSKMGYVAEVFRISFSSYSEPGSDLSKWLLDNSKQFSTSLEGDVVFFRDRNYFFYRPEDISEKSLNKFVKQMPAGLDGWSSFCATLSEAQMRVICADEFVWPQGMQIPGDMMAPNFFTLRFWGFLHPIQRERAISEQGLPVDHLSRSQQTAMQAALGQMLIPDPFATIERIHVTNTPSHGYCFMMDGVPMNFVEDLAEAKQMFKEQDPKSTDFIVERTQDYYEFDFVLPDGQIYQDSFPFSQFKRVDAKDTGKTPNAGG